MSSALTREQVIELLPLFVLGSLEADEMLAVSAYLEAHPDLSSRLQELEEATALLAYSAPHTPLPAGAKQALMNRVEPQTPKVIVTPTPASPNALQRLLEWWQNLNRWPLATAVSFALLLLVSLYTLQLRADVADLREANDTLVSENESLQAVNNRLQEELNENNQLFAQLPSAERVIPLPGTEEDPDAAGVFLVNGSEGVFVLRNLEPLLANQIYQLWLVPPGGGAPDAVSVGLLETLSEAGAGQQAVMIPAGLEDFAIVDVSIEPAGGSQNLSGPVVIRALVEQ